MRISLNWLKSLFPLEEDAETISQLLTDSGLEVESVEHVSSVRGGLKGLIIGEVIECEQHPNADKLKLTKVNTGTGELLGIVCGAPNVRKGLKVVVAPVNTTVHPAGSEAFQIKKAKIRGEVSEGMLCAEDEIGLGESHAGLMELPQDWVPGKLLSDYIQVEEDTVIEIGLTANRGDAASHLGVARELAALTGRTFNYKIEDSIMFQEENPISVTIKNPEDCPRYSSLYIHNIQIGSSPEFIQNRLKVLGLQPINNIVDITNYVMMETGQPLHAFDAGKITDNKIIVERATASEKFVTLDGKEHTLKGHELMIRDTARSLCMAGVYGGLESGVTENTSSIFLESAYFSPDVVRKGAKSSGLSTDSSFRFERGTDPEMTIPALRLAYKLLKEYAGASEHPILNDQYPLFQEPSKIELRKKRIQSILGIEIPDNKIEEILKGLGIQILNQDEKSFSLSVPKFKSDVTREIDVIEEIIRIYGFEHIPLKQHMSIPLKTESQNALRKIEKGISEILRANGFREIMTNSLTASKGNPEEVKMSNPLSKEMEVLRDSMLDTALESVAYNKNRKNLNIRFFEFGHIYSRTESGFRETAQLILMSSGNQSEESWEKKPVSTDLYFLQRIIGKLNTRYRNNKVKWNLAEVDSALKKKHGLKSDVQYAVCNWTEYQNTGEFRLNEIPQFPGSRRDLSLIIDKSLQYQDILKVINGSQLKHLEQVKVFDIYEGKPLEEGKKSVSLAFDFLNRESTLADQDIDPQMERLIQNFEKNMNALIRK